MAEAIPIVDAGARGLYPIRTVSELTGVNAITLRAWEKRHDLVTPIRKESGHRLYTQEHIDLINRVVGLLDRGMRIGQVKAYLDAEANEAKDSEAPAISDTWRRYLDGMVAAVIRFDEEALETVYNEALAHHDIKRVSQQLLTPLLVELGRRWEAGLGSVAEEHFFGFYLRNKLGARFHHRARNTDGPRVLMACLPGERHEVGLLLFALAANDAGYRPVVLGADMPLLELTPAAEKVGADAIVLSGFIEPSRNVMRRQLPELVASTSVPVLLGGRVSVDALDDLRRIGIEPLGMDVEAGLKRLETTLGVSA